MAVELGSITLQHLTRIDVEERARIVRHSVPGLAGDLAQTMGRSSVALVLKGIFYGPTVDDDLKQLRELYLQHQPVDLFTEAIGEGYFAQVLIANLKVTQRAGVFDQFDFQCEVVEYVQPPEPAAPDVLSALDADLLSEAAGFMDDVQNAMELVSELTDLIANVPNFGNPTEQLPKMLDSFADVTSGGLGTLQEILDLF